MHETHHPSYEPTTPLPISSIAAFCSPTSSLSPEALAFGEMEAEVRKVLGSGARKPLMKRKEFKGSRSSNSIYSL